MYDIGHSGRRTRLLEGPNRTADAPSRRRKPGWDLLRRRSNDHRPHGKGRRRRYDLNEAAGSQRSHASRAIPDSQRRDSSSFRNSASRASAATKRRNVRGHTPADPPPPPASIAAPSTPNTRPRTTSSASPPTDSPCPFTPAPAIEHGLPCKPDTSSVPEADTLFVLNNAALTAWRLSCT